MNVLLQCLVGGILIGSIYALLATGLSLVYSIMKLINFAHGELLMLSMYGAFFFWQKFSLDPIFSIPLTAMMMAILGICIYYGIVKRIYGSSSLTQVFATYGMSILILGLAQFLWTPNFKSVSTNILSGNLEIFNIYISKAELVGSIVSVATFMALYWFLNRTKVGRALQATSENINSASLMGINYEHMFAIAWAIAMALVAVGGGILASYYYIFPEVGRNFIIILFVAVAIGGFGNIAGAFIGGILVGVVEALAGVYLSASYKYAIIYMVYLLVVVLMPQGLLGKSKG